KPPIPPNRPSIGSRAPRTHPSPGPPQSCEVFGAGIFAAKAPFQLQQGLRKILAHDSERYILGLVASSKYPYRALIDPCRLAKGFGVVFPNFEVHQLHAVIVLAEELN